MTLNEEIENIKSWYETWLVNKGYKKNLTSFVYFMGEKGLLDIYNDFGMISSEVLGV